MGLACFVKRRYVRPTGELPGGIWRVSKVSSKSIRVGKGSAPRSNGTTVENNHRGLEILPG